MIVDDNKLVNETLSGKIESFGLIVEKYQKVVFNLAFRMTNDYDVAKDITQESFIKAFFKLNSFNSKYKFFSWLYRIALNECFDFQKKQNKNENDDNEIYESGNTPLEEIEEVELKNRVNKAINMLDEKYKSVIILKHFENLSYEEISEILLLPIKVIKSRLYMAREILRLSLGDFFNERWIINRADQ